MSHFTASAWSSAAPAAVWAYYLTPERWLAWDADLRSVSWAGALAVGVRGRLQAQAGPAAAFAFTQVEAGRSFRSESRLPLCRVEFDHVLTPQGGGTQIAHAIRFAGPLAWLWRRLAGPAMAKGLPASVARLAELAAHAPLPVS